MIPEWIDYFNNFAWVASNLLVLYIGVVLVVFVVGYSILFNPRATTAGRMIFRFVFSLIGLIGLIILGFFVNPSAGREWFAYPGDVFVWRPAVRLAAYLYISYTITSLAVLLGIRKWRPDLIKIKDKDELAKPRNSK